MSAEEHVDEVQRSRDEWDQPAVEGGEIDVLKQAHHRESMRAANAEARIRELEAAIRRACDRWINDDEDDAACDLWRLVVCEQDGHVIIDDHCGKPEHRYCIRCRTLETEIDNG